MAETPLRNQEDIDIEQRQLALMKRGPRGAGGTPGGIGTFFLGFILAVAGGYLVLNQVSVTSNYGGFFGWLGMGNQGGFGLTMLPMLVGIGLLFVNGKSLWGRLLTLGGVVMIIAAVLMSMRIHWNATSLFNTILMFGMLAAGIGLCFRSFRAYPTTE